MSPSLPWNYLDRSRQPIRIAKEMSGKQRNLRFYDMSMELSLPKVRVPHGEPDSKGPPPTHCASTCSVYRPLEQLMDPRGPEGCLQLHVGGVAECDNSLVNLPLARTRQETVDCC